MKKRVLMRVSKIKFSSTRRARWFGWMALTVAALCTGLPAQAATDSETQIWTSATLQSDPSHASGVVGWLDLHARRGTGSTVYILRPGIGYRLIQGVTGYDRTPDLATVHPSGKRCRRFDPDAAASA